MKRLQSIFYERFLIRSRHSLADTKAALVEIIEPKRLGWFSLKFSNSRLFEGSFFGNRFTIRRRINYQNSFLPLINGEILDLNSHVTISVEMKPNQIVIFVWYAFIFVFGIIAVVTPASSFFGRSSKFLEIALIMLLMITPPVAFSLEGRKAKKLLRQALGS